MSPGLPETEPESRDTEVCFRHTLTVLPPILFTMCSCHYSLLFLLLSLSQCLLFTPLLNKWIDGDRGFFCFPSLCCVQQWQQNVKQSFTVFQKNYPCVIYSCHTTDELSMVLLAFVNLVPDNLANQSFQLLTYRTGLSRATPLETCHGDSLYSERASLQTSDWTRESKVVFTHFDFQKNISLLHEVQKLLHMCNFTYKMLH